MERLHCYVYGAGEEYNRLASYLALYRKQIDVLGVVTTYKQCFDKIDGLPCIRPEEIELSQMDYVIIAVQNWKEIYGILQKRGVGEEKILRSSAFYLPNFDLGGYLKLKKSNVSILANTCLGGRVYRDLGLKALSPTINMACRGKDYLDFLDHYEHYLQSDMREVYAEAGEHIPGAYDGEFFMPKGVIEDKILWYFPHVSTSEDTVKKWNQKRKAINYGNIAAMMVLRSDEEAVRFEKLPIKKKLGFYFKELHLKSVVYCQEWEKEEVRFQYGHSWVSYANRAFLNYVDLIKFLNGEADYVRHR